MKTKPCFSLNIDRSGGYNVLHINVYHDHGNLSPRRAASIRFQSNATSPDDWYGSTIELTADSMEGLTSSAKLIQKLLPMSDKYTHFRIYGNVRGVLQVLLKTCVEVVYDNRLSRLIPIAEVLPREFGAYRDDWNAYGQSDGCTVGCVARDDDEARRLLTKEFADLSGSYRQERFEKWLSAGRPIVRLTHHYDAPVIAITAEELLSDKKDEAKVA